MTHEQREYIIKSLNEKKGWILYGAKDKGELLQLEFYKFVDGYEGQKLTTFMLNIQWVDVVDK